MDYINIDNLSKLIINKMIKLINLIIKAICWLLFASIAGICSIIISLILWDETYFEKTANILESIFKKLK